MSIVTWEFESPPLHFSSTIGGNSSVGRARPCQGRGREFESRLPLTFWIKPIENFLNAQVAELVDAHVSGACAARRAGSIPVLGTIPIEDSAGGVIHFTPPIFCLCRFGVAIIWAHPTNLGD